MRLLEIGLVIANLAVLLGWAWAAVATTFWFRILPGVAGGLLIAHLLIERYRLQMAPLYAVTLCIMVVGCLQYFRAVEIPMPAIVAGIAAVLISVAAGWAVPVFRLPKPSGPYRIGTLVYHVTGSPLNSDPARHELMAQVWYPSDALAAGPGDSYRPYPRGLLPWKTSHLALVETHATRGAPLSSHMPQYPLLLFSPSWGGQRGQNMVLVEHLVSHGFVVVGIDHPHSSGIVVFPDGHVVREDPDPGEDYSSEAVFQAFLAAGEKRLRARVDDVELVLNAIEEWHHHDPQGVLTGRLDLDRIGIFGHSFGGAVAAEACRLDPRLKAGVDMDGLLFGRTASEGVNRPFLFFSEDVPSPSPTAARGSVEGRMFVISSIQKTAIRRTFDLREGYCVRVRGAYHRNYSDSPLFSPFRFLTHAGPIEPRRAFEIVNDYVLNFFQYTLLGLPAPLMKGPSPKYPEATIEISLAGKSPS